MLKYVWELRINMAIKENPLKRVPDAQPYLADKEYRGRCLEALKGYYTTFGVERTEREPRTLQGYANKMGVYLDDVIEVMQQQGVGMPSYKWEARKFLRKLAG
jgi:hypothetical protein